MSSEAKISPTTQRDVICTSFATILTSYEEPGYVMIEKSKTGDVYVRDLVGERGDTDFVNKIPKDSDEKVRYVPLTVLKNVHKELAKKSTRNPRYNRANLRSVRWDNFAKLVFVSVQDMNDMTHMTYSFKFKTFELYYVSEFAD